MPSLRDRSKITPRTCFDTNYGIKYSNKKKWTLEDKKRLLIYIKRYGVSEILSNSNLYFSDRTSNEINEYIEDIKKKEFPNNFEEHYLSTRIRNPLEIWQDTFKDLTSKITDYSNCISTAVDNIICTEKFDVCTSEEDLDWKLIYKYLYSALRQDPLPKLYGINAAVILKLLDSTMGNLDNLNIESQRNLLLSKLELLENNKNEGDIFKKLTTINKALLLGNPDEDKWNLLSGENLDNLLLDVQKESLYFLNPINIPIKLLRPRPLNI